MLGKLQLVKSVTPLEVKKREDEESSADCVPYSDKSSEEGEEPGFQSDATVMKECRSETSNPPPDVDLGDLTEDQKIAVVNMLKEEPDSFSKDDDDVGSAEGLQLKINLSDNRPVQKNYTAIPKPLYPEVKQYAEKVTLSLLIASSLCAEKGRFFKTVCGLS